MELLTYIAQKEFLDFINLVQSYWPKDYDLKNYKIDVARIASLARGKFFPEETEKSIQRTEKWKEWITAIPSGETLHPQWGYLPTFKETMISSMRKGDGREIFAFAFHYRLHKYHREEDLTLADQLDIKFFKKPLRKLGQQVFRYEPDIYDMLQPNAPFDPPPYLRPEDINGELDWLNPHNHHSLQFTPRTNITSQLDSMMNSDDTFRLCPIIGPSGAGKTRLLSEWMKPYVLTKDQKQCNRLV